MALPYDYYPAVLYAINGVGQGRTLTDACYRANIPVSTFNTYLERDGGLKAQYEEALQQSYDAMADALVNIHNHKVHGQSDAKMAKVVSDNIKWVLSKRRPKDFGDRVMVDHSVTVDVAITTALDAARKRVPAPEVMDVSSIPEADVVYDPAAEDADIMRELLG